MAAGGMSEPSPGPSADGESHPLRHVRIAILTKWQSYFFAQNSLEIKGLSDFQQQIRKTYLSIKQEGLLHCYHSW